jgi:hypothetical protein
VAARYEKARVDHRIVDVAVLVATGVIGPRLRNHLRPIPLNPLLQKTIYTTKGRGPISFGAQDSARDQENSPVMPIFC